ncbi:membrane protein insertion efficiency factor YidD [Xanthobacter sediminis]|uniref:membrane protein insertion efficiency factor YidD n=1 Tax=Xanthobacter sediminis TaxID=3119926 RepID=UPI00372C9041
MRPSEPRGGGSALDELPWTAPKRRGWGLPALIGRVPRAILRAPILLYRYTLSSFMGRQCRYLPTCSEYADEAISRHGAWPGLFMATARLCRCHPWGGHGYDPVPGELSPEGRWYLPWRYGRWRCEAPPQDE